MIEDECGVVDDDLDGNAAGGAAIADLQGAIEDGWRCR